MADDAKVLMIYGIDRAQREALLIRSEKKGYRSVSEMFREEFINSLMRRAGVPVYEDGRPGKPRRMAG